MKTIILVDDMPSKCHGCRYDDFDYRCALTGFDHEDYVMRGTRDIRCPLKPMPSKRKSMVEWVDANVKTHDLTEYDKGWNDCVEFLEGGEQ